MKFNLKLKKKGNFISNSDNIMCHLYVEQNKAGNYTQNKDGLYEVRLVHSGSKSNNGVYMKADSNWVRIHTGTQLECLIVLSQRIGIKRSNLIKIGVL